MEDRSPDKDKPLTLSDADITSGRKMSRRALLGTLGIGAGAATVAVFGSATPALADRAKTSTFRDNDPGDRAKKFRDNDPLTRDTATKFRDRDTTKVGDKFQVPRDNDR